MRTISGVHVTPEGGTIPPLEDFAYGLKQIVRFGGQTVVQWTVAQHLLVCMGIARWQHDQYASVARFLTIDEMYLGFHDMHEALTSDIPRPFKTEDQGALQDDLDDRILRRFGIPSLNGQPVMRAYIKEVDNRALLAEAAVVCPTATYAQVSKDLGGLFTRNEDVQTVYDVLTLVPYPGETWRSRMAELIERNGGRV